jgi:hypothetical protein
MWHLSRHATGLVHETVSGPVGRVVEQWLSRVCWAREIQLVKHILWNGPTSSSSKCLFSFNLAAGASAWGSEYYELSIHVMQAGKSNWGLEISMGPLLFRSQGFPVHHLPRGNTGSRRGFV